MNKEGTAYVLQWAQEVLPDFIKDPEVEELKNAPIAAASKWKTLFISGGRRDKISKGDIAGLFFKQGQLNKDQLGTIELKQDCAFVAILESKADELIPLVNNSKLKMKKVRVTAI